MMCFGMKERKRSRTNHCVIVLLDDTQLVHELQPSSTGQDLLDVVIKHLNLLETSYFGLRYLEPAQEHGGKSSDTCESRKSQEAQCNANNTQHARQTVAATTTTDSKQQQVVWLDMKRNAIKQLRLVQPMTLYFGVKYYASDPCKLAEEITRYQFFLQCKQDILHGRLPVSYELAVELFALAVQSELGDFDPTRHQAPEYVSEFQFCPAQSQELEMRVSQFHRKLAGQVPATAELNFLERVKWLDLYGCELHAIQYNEEHERDEYALGLNPGGVLVLRNRVKVAQYAWDRIQKTKCQGRCFLMDVIEQQQHQTNQTATQVRRHRFGFRLADKLAAQRLRWSFDDHKSFQFLIRHNSTSLLGSHSRSQMMQQQQPPLKLSQKFRYSIRSAMGVHNNNSSQNVAAPIEYSQENYHSMRHPQQQERASLQQKQYAANGLSRPPPNVVRMPSRRLSNRSAAAFRASIQQAPPPPPTFCQEQANGLPAVPPAGSSATMVESQRALMMMMMQQQQQQQQQQYQQQFQQQAKSQTLRPNMSKEKMKASYYEQLMSMQYQHQNRMLPPDVAIVPPGRHVVQHAQQANIQAQVIHYPTAAATNTRQQQQQAPSIGLQLYGGPAMSMGQYRGSRGHESPRSTKSAIAASSAIKLASKKLAKHSKFMQQQHQQQALIYHQPSDQTPLLLAYQQQQNQEPLGKGEAGCYYPVAYNLASLHQVLPSSANVSPRSVRSARMAGLHQRSKSTGENLHLLHHSQSQRQQHAQVAGSYAESKAALLLSTVGGQLGLPRHQVQQHQLIGYDSDGLTASRQFNGANSKPMIKRASIRPTIPLNPIRPSHFDDEPDYSSESDCHSQKQQSKRNSYTHNKNIDLNNNNNNNNNNNASSNSLIVKNIANKQATPILLTMNSNASDLMSNGDSRGNSTKAIQLLTSQRQQLQHHQKTMDETLNKNRKSPSLSQCDSVESPSSSGVIDSPSAASSLINSASSSPKQHSNDNNKQMPSIVQSALKSSTSKTIKMQSGTSEQNSANSTCGSANSATSGYYGGSQNSTGSASLDSDSTQSRNLHYATNSNGTESDHWAHSDGPRVTIGQYGVKSSGATTASMQRPMLASDARAYQLMNQAKLSNNRHSDASNKQHYLLDDNQHRNDSQMHENSLQRRHKQTTNQNHSQNGPSSLKYVSFDV